MLDLTVIPVEHLLGLANSAVGQSDFDGAERVLREALRRTPGNVDALISLAHVLTAKSARAEAVAFARQAVARAPRDWRSHSTLGECLASGGELEPAVRSFRTALALHPEDPSTLVSLAQMLERLRQGDEAMELATRALRSHPGHGGALNLLGELAMQSGDLESADRWLSEAVSASSIDARAEAWHRLGALREKQRRWDEAFVCHERGNRVTLSSPAARAMLEVPLFDHLESHFLPDSAAMLARWSACEYPQTPPDPVFLVGFPRSGTTLVENVLGAMPGTLTTDEQPVINSAYAMAIRDCGDPPLAELGPALDALSHERIMALRAEYWRSMAMMVSPNASRARLVVDKSPLRFVQLLLISRLFPRSRVIFVVRDPRDCCLSCFFQFFTLSPSLVRFTSLETTGDTYATVMRFWMRARTRITMPWMEVRYEEMVADFEPHARKLVAFVGREWSDDVLRFHERASGRAIRTPSYRAVTEKINTRAVGRWANYEKHLGPLIERVRPFLDPLGYEE